MLLIDRNRQSSKVLERQYAKAINKYYKFFNIDKKYILDLKSKKSNTIRFIMLAEKIGDRYICFQVTSKKKMETCASSFPGCGKHGIDIWISYESIWLNENQINNFEKKLIFTPQMISIHMRNIKIHSTTTNPYYRRYLEVKLHLIQLEERQHGKKIKSQQL